MPNLVLEHILTGPAKVDRTARVIRGVKVLGLLSTNTGRALGLDPREYGDAVDQPYRYSLDAVREAIPLYEGIAVNIDHPPTNIDASGRRLIRAAGRSTGDRFGRLIYVHLGDGGLVADLEYLAAHPLAEMVVETAERMPEQLALSHHARCEFALVQGQVVAKKITAVHSVDIIADPPGTTTSLFESSPPSKEPVVNRRTLLELAESFAADVWGSAALRRLLQEGLVSPELAVELPAGEDTPTAESQLSAAFRATLLAAANQPDLLKACQQTTELLEAWQSRLTLKEATSTETLAALRQENLRLKAREQARLLIEAAGLQPAEPLLKAVAALENRAEQEDLLRSLTQAPLAARPRSSEPLSTFADTFPRPNGSALAQLLHSR